jgi:hypothetical protein
MAFQPIKSNAKMDTGALPFGIMQIVLEQHRKQYATQWVKVVPVYIRLGQLQALPGSFTFDSGGDDFALRFLYDDTCSSQKLANYFDTGCTTLDPGVESYEIVGGS